MWHFHRKYKQSKMLDIMRIRHVNQACQLIILSCCTMSAITASDNDNQAKPRVLAWQNPDAPRFDWNRVENHTVQMGGTALLPCVIKNLGNESVSWIRMRDAYILTVDEEVFISDPRISTIHQDNSLSWTLQIKSVQPEDASKYECQVSTEPKMSHFVGLQVRVPKVHIFGDQDIFVKSSSTVHMKCVISQSLEPPNYIEWRHNEQRLSPGLGGHTRIQATPPEHIAEGTTMSTLTILEAAKSDSGEYTCHPAQMDKARVMLHVLDTDYPAAMQTSDSCPGLFSRSAIVFCVALMCAIPVLAGL